MTAVAWTLVGLLAASVFGSFYSIHSRIDNLASEMNARFDSLTSGTNGRFDAVNARLDYMNARLTDHVERPAG